MKQKWYIYGISNGNYFIVYYFFDLLYISMNSVKRNKDNSKVSLNQKV